jgi:hypothetical protein
MTTIGPPIVEPPAPTAVRPDLFAYPAPTTVRFCMLLVALLGSGLFVGNWLHGEVAGRDWVRATLACETRAQEQTAGLDDLQQLDTKQRILNACRAGAERERAGFMLGGAAAVGLGGLIVLYVAPRVVERRRRLRPPGPRLQPVRERFGQLAAEAGVTRVPLLLLGSSTQRDAFSYGAPGRYRVALPPAVAVRWRDQELFDPLIRHELAHIRHRDVTWAWLARSIWFVLAPLLLLPIISGVVSGDLSLIPDYAWRAALLGITVQFISAALLRSREYDADLRSARTSGGPEKLSRAVALASSRVLPWYRRPLARHPTPADRLAVLEYPARGSSITFWDGFAAAFLAALTAPLVLSLLITLFTGSAPTTLSELVVALTAGPLLGGAVGLGLWRASVVTRTAGAGVSPWGAAVGVAVGLVLGQVASLGQVGAGLSSDLEKPIGLVLLAVAGLGATLIVYSAGEVWADAAPALRWAWLSWVPAIAVTGIVFAAVLWASQQFRLSLNIGGWQFVRQWLVYMPQRWVVVTAVVALAAALVVALTVRRRGRQTPAWIIEQGEPVPWPVGRARFRTVAVAALAAGFVGAVTIVAFRMSAGPATSDAQTLQRFEAYIWLAATLGFVTAAVLAVLVPRYGVGLGSLGGCLATVTVMAGFLALNTALGGDLNREFVADSLLPPIVLGFLLTVAVAPVSWLARSLARSGTRAWAITTPAALIAAIAVIGVIGVTSPPSREIALPDQPSSASTAQQYVATVAPDLVQRYDAIESAVNAIDGDRVSDGPSRAERVRTEVVTPLQALLDQMESYRPPTPAVDTVHASALTALRTAIESFEMFALAFETGDTALFADALAKRTQEQQLWQAWQAGVAELVGPGQPTPGG